MLFNTIFRYIYLCIFPIYYYVYAYISIYLILTKSQLSVLHFTTEETDENDTVNFHRHWSYSRQLY